ncbi:SpoIIE family protein phosphatase [Bacteroidota bacterium]
MIKFSYYILTIIILLKSSALVYADDFKVTFKVIPESLPPESVIYITGNHSELGEWVPYKVELEKQTDRSWTKTFSFNEGTHLEYKFTRGSWSNEMVDSSGIELPNFILDVYNDTTVIVKISNWRDTYMGVTVLSLERMQNKAGSIELYENWKYHPGDNPIWAEPGYDDLDWRIVDTRLPPEEYPNLDWQGIGWFRIHLKVDSSLWDRPLSLMIRHTGASEIYLNGKLLYQIGKVGNTEENEIIYTERNPKYILFDRQTDQVLAIRYSNFLSDYILKLKGNPGIDVFLIDLNEHIESRITDTRVNANYQMIFTAVPIVLAFLHLMLFLYTLGARENLYYSICMIGFAALSYGNFQGTFTTNVYHNNVVLLSVNVALLFGLLTVYSRTYEKIPKQFYFFVLIAVFFVTFVYIYPLINTFIYFNIFLFITSLEILRVIFKSAIKRQGEALLVGAGFVVLFISIIYQILIESEILEPIGGNRIVYVYGVLALSIAMSINLARDFARMNERIISQERKAKEQEIERRILETDNVRKTQELEEARQLQLSLLPKTLPKLPNLDIAVYMKTATEVGGDYYDFHVSMDKTLSVVIGDATGHGMKAGNMVISIKSLFNSLPPDMEIPDFFNRCTSIIRRMNMKQLYMCLTLIRIQDNKIILSSAGMPPILLYKEKSKDVESIILKGMPLGAADDFPYQQTEKELSPGDTLLMMSDGFIELFNEDKQTLDVERAKTHFKEIAHNSPNEIISHLNKEADKWRGSRPLNDDMTFVVLKYKDS